MKVDNSGALPSSFRDPDGFVFARDGTFYRQVSRGYAENYERLMKSGLYATLVRSALLVPHEEVRMEEAEGRGFYRILRPERIPFVSYPNEWCFSQLKNAALATLQIQKTALDFGMTLKDSSAFNIQFLGWRPIFIDTLSFEGYREGAPWMAYKQFCEHFLCPLALMRYKDIRLQQLLRFYIHGIPLQLGSSLLPCWTYAKFPLLAHLHLHARSQCHFEAKSDRPKHQRMRRSALLALVENLETFVGNMRCPRGRTNWKDYYATRCLYSTEAQQFKRKLVQQFLDEVRPKMLWDFGANTGSFSRVASDRGVYTVSMDMDPLCVEENYLQAVNENEKDILPLLTDLTNPSPAQGWAHQERMSLQERGPVDAALALALVHHLAFGNNLPLSRLADFFGRHCQHLLIEFVPKDDPQSRKLLAPRGDIFPDYSRQHFEAAFEQNFRTWNAVKVEDTERVMYFMSRNTQVQ